MIRTVQVLCNPAREEFVGMTRTCMDTLHAAGMSVTVCDLLDGDCQVPPHVDLVVVLGGDGSILRAADLARQHDALLLGVNLGRVGFLAAAERDSFTHALTSIISGDFEVEERSTLEVTVELDGSVLTQGWALNEVTVEKAARERMIDVSVAIDDSPLSYWGCDGVIVATPTGSTAYAFSAGGPVVWPSMQALIVTPISAHTLFGKPLVLPHTSAVTLTPSSANDSDAVMWCDGVRTVGVPRGAVVTVHGSSRPVRCVTVNPTTFTERLVRKFDLDVNGWRGKRRDTRTSG